MEIVNNASNILSNYINAERVLRLRYVTNPVNTDKKTEIKTEVKEDEDSAVVSEEATETLLKSDEINAKKGLNIVNEYSKSLGEIREKLNALRQTLADSKDIDAEGLLQLDEKANSLIDEIMNIHSDINLKTKGFSLNTLTDNLGNFVLQFGSNIGFNELVINSNIYLDGLSSLKTLFLTDDKYFDKMLPIAQTVLDRENYYSNIKTDLYSILDKITQQKQK